VAAAASWTRAAHGYGPGIGNEAWNKGANVVLGPTITSCATRAGAAPSSRLSEDPYLAAELGAADIQGIQSQARWPR